MDAYKIVKYPLSTEKSIRIMETHNKLVFVVDIDADKNMIKNAIESMYKVKVSDVKTLIQYGQKRAYVKFSPDNPAIDIATKMGLM
jgi:ribosomal protein L23